jgi:hypothetical protein
MGLEEQNAQSLVEGDEHEVAVDSEGKVTLQGEEIPADVTLDESPVVDETPPKTEETTSESEKSEQESRTEGTGDEVVLTEVEKAFADDESLVKRHGTLKQMVVDQGKTDKYVTDLEAERNYYRDMATPNPVKPEVKSPSFEDFNEDPMGTIDKLIQSRMVGQDKKIQKIEYNNFVQSKSDFTDVEPFMDEQLKQNPNLAMLGYDALPILYKMAKADQIARAKATQPQPVPVPKPDKTHAETSAGKKKAVLSTDDPRYWHGKSQKEIEDEVGFAPQQE